jgi:molybdopterin-guanine dinucleotide biosynthesis protein A
MSASAIVLCGGRSTRMGQDKALLPFGGEILLARVVRIVRGVADEVVLVTREGQALPDGFEAVRDPAEGLGPLAGIATGLRNVTSDRAFVTGCDAPLLRPALIQRLFQLADGYDAAVPLIDGRFMTTTAVYARSIVSTAEALIAKRELRTSGLLDHIRVRAIEPAELRDVDPDLDSFRTCNTPADYADAIRRSRIAAP